MTCPEFKQLAASYALGALDAEERAACEQHLQLEPHEGCREALIEANEIASAIPLGLPPLAPPPELWERIALKVEGVRPIGSAPRRRKAPWIVAAVGWAAAAASAAGLLYFRDRGEVAVARVAVAQRETLARAELVDQCRRELEVLKLEKDAREKAIALLHQPDTRVLPMGAGTGRTVEEAKVLFNPTTGRAVVMGQGLKAPAGRDYELWVIPEDQPPIPAGLLRADAEGRITMEVDASAMAKGVGAFAISIEPAGGSPSPSGPIVLMGKV